MYEFVNMVVDFCSSFGYTWIFLMMVLESSFIPFPSEVAMIPAWYLVSTWEMNFRLAFLAWTAWALLWATINYMIWYFLWWKKLIHLINRYWKFFFVKESHYHISENYFKKHWMVTIFLARFITVVRQIISLPAGVFKINFPKFFIFTWIWAWWWNLILLYIGFLAWENSDLIKQYSHIVLIWTLLLIVVIWFLYYYMYKYFDKKYNK